MLIPWWVLAALVVAAVLWLWRRKRKPDIPPQSIVALLAKPHGLNVYTLAELLTRASGRSVQAIELVDEPGTADDKNPVGDMVTGRPPQFIASVDVHGHSAS